MATEADPGIGRRKGGRRFQSPDARPELSDGLVAPEERTFAERRLSPAPPERDAPKADEEAIARWRSPEPGAGPGPGRTATPPAFLADGPDAELEGQFAVRLKTSDGVLRGRLQLCPGAAAVLWVTDAGGGAAGSLYAKLGRMLRREAVASLEMACRRPGRLADCVRDVETALAYLESLGKRRIVLVGYAFGGAVAIQAAARQPQVVAVAALSSQALGADRVAELSPRPVIFMHGEADEVLPSRCSADLYARAREPKEIVLYPGGRHGLEQCRQALDRDLLAWLRRVAPAA